MRRWFGNRLARLLAAAYVAARARATAALPHDEQSCRITNRPDADGSGSGPVRHRGSQSNKTKRQPLECELHAAPPEQPDGNKA
jgi:hypothetical protein